MNKSLQTILSQSKYQWLNDPNVQIEDFGNYIIINIKDSDNNLISQILTTIYDLNKIKPYFESIIEVTRRIGNQQSSDQGVKIELFKAKAIDLDKQSNQQQLINVKTVLNDLKTKASYFNLFELNNFYQCDDPRYLIVTTNGDYGNLWKKERKLKNPLHTIIDCSSIATIKKDLLVHIKKLVALLQINKYFNSYINQLFNAIPNLLKTKQNQQLVKKFYQNSQFEVNVDNYDQISIDHYWNDQLITTYKWLLNYNLKTGDFTISDEILGMLALHDSITQVLKKLSQINDQINNHRTKVKKSSKLLI